MAQVTITINSREYAIACDDGQEAHIIKLSRILDEKAKQLSAGGRINENMLLAMVGLLLADELLEARNGVMPTIPEPEVQVVEKIVEVEQIVEKVKVPNLAPLDEKLATSLKEVAEQIESLVSEVEAI